MGLDSAIERMPPPLVLKPRGISVVMVPRPVKEVVSWFGSIETFPQFDAGEETTQDVVTSLLNKGTRRRDRFEVAAELEDRGAEISFRSNATRVHFSGRALARDVPHILRLTAEQLAEPLLAAEEFAKTIQRMRAGLKRSSQNTSYRASVALHQRLFPEGHPNYSLEPAGELEVLSKCTLEAAEAYHRHHFGGGNLAICAAGDLDPEQFASSVGEAFGHWEGGSRRGAFDVAGLQDEEEGRSEIHLEERDNLDVCLGHAVHLRRNDPDFVTLWLANYILGGNFSARLMTKVRNEMGLTYGIGSTLSGFDASYEGLWQISVTLSKDRLEAGLEATRAEVTRFLESGVTQAELDAKKTTICGSYEVGLSTTRGLAHTMHANLRNGFPPSYLNEFPSIIRSLSLEEVNDALSKYFADDQLRVAVAGSLPGDS